MNEIISVEIAPGILDRIRYRPRRHDSVDGRIAAAILADPVRVSRESITDFATRTEVSVGSVVRFTRFMGCDGFRDFKIALATELPTRLAPGTAGREESTFATHMKLQINALSFAAREVDANLIEEAAALIVQARRIDIVATGDSAAIAQSLLFWLTAMGFHSRHLIDSAEQPAAAGFLGPGDVLVAISFSGRTRTVVEATNRASANGATVIALTCSQRSPLARGATVPICADAQKAGMSDAEWPLRSALFAISRALSLAVQQHLSRDDAGHRRAVWASGRFGLRLT